MQYESSGESVGFDLRMTGGGESCRRGTREINESDRKQDVNAMQERGRKGTENENYGREVGHCGGWAARCKSGVCGWLVPLAKPWNPLLP